MQATEAVLQHGGGAWDASLNHYDTGGSCMVTTKQVDKWVYAVGQDDFSVGRYTLAEWTGEAEQGEVPMIECDDEVQAWELLRLLREDCLLWQCGGCDAWISPPTAHASPSFSARPAAPAARTFVTRTATWASRERRPTPPTKGNERTDLAGFAQA